MRPDVSRWFDRRTYEADQFGALDLFRRKDARRISVVLPALNEEETVGPIVATIRRDLVDAVPLVDELVVMDSGSTDRTAERAAAAGATVVHRAEVLPRIPVVPGKGEVMWRALAATTGDILVYVDSDLREFSSHFVTGLLGPLLVDRSVAFVKGVYDRPLADGQTVLPAGGGRVTELVARPLLNLHWPELAGFVQPLAGECAARRDLLEHLPFPCGYGVETGLLIDTLERVGLDAMAQVDLGVRLHKHQSDAALGTMAAQIWQAALDRLERAHPSKRWRQIALTLTQFERDTEGYRAQVRDVAARERPPMMAIPDYAALRAVAS